MVATPLALQFGPDHTIVGISMDTENKGHLEASFTGFGFGAILGGFVVGASADMLNAPIHTLLAYAIGGVLGAMAGLVAGRVAARVIFP